MRGVVQRATPAPPTIGPNGARWPLGGPGRLQVPISCRGAASTCRSGREGAASVPPSHGGRVTVADSPGAPLPSWPRASGAPATSRERGRCRQRSLDPGTGVTGPLGPQSWARDTAVWTCLGLRLLFPEDWAPTPRAQPRSLNPVFPNTEPHLNPFLTFLAVREEWQVIPGAHAVQRGILLGSFTSFTAFHRI